jgi:phosphoribosylanthranilate isomerase
MSLIVKICGLSTPETLDVAIAEGADMVGFVFFPPSPRHVSFDTARLLGEHVRGRARKVALTVDADDATLAAIVESLRPDLLQLHGKETPERVSTLKQRFGLSMVKALGVEAKSDFDRVKDYASVAEWLLFDAKAPAGATRPGGLGKPFDWALLSGAIPGKGVMLSGGLDASNVAEALKITRVPGVDVSSGVESAPGVKDIDKIRKFIHAARRAHIDLADVPYEILSNP